MTQMHLLDEFLARFHGPARERWYLSDGGHSENTACYELIRRRVPFIIVTDGGQDQNYEFEDLANLVRRVRTDFQAEIEFLARRNSKAQPATPPDDQLPYLEDLVDPALLNVIGTLEDFQPPPKKDPADDLPPHTRAHALLARVRYPNTPRHSYILFIKPSVTGDEPLDVIQYQESHPDFPQETTMDQYFNEAQWESYRRLGEHIGSLLFGSRPTGSGKWVASQMHAPES